MGTIQVLLGLTHVKSYALLMVPFTVVVSSVFVYYEYGGGSHLSGTSLGVCYIFGCAVSVSVMGFAMFTEYGYAHHSWEVVSLAGVRAAHALAVGGGIQEGDELQRATFYSFKKRATLGVVLCFPILFLMGVLLVLVVGIVAMFKLRDDTWWKIFVTMIALGIKIVGNKGMLILLGSGG